MIATCGQWFNARESKEMCLSCEGTGETHDRAFDEGEVDVVDPSRAPCACCGGRGLHLTANAESYARTEVHGASRRNNHDVFAPKLTAVA